MMNPKSNLILEGLHSKDVREQILKTEGTTSSDISTPSGTLNQEHHHDPDKEYTCPKCGSTDVIITDEGKYHCTKCEYEWPVDGKQSEVSEKKRKVVETKKKS
jgi:ribosomal protein L37AE/L43A